MAKQAVADLVIAGFGSQAGLQLTLEAQQLSVRAGRVLTLGLPERIGAVLKRQGVAIRELDDALDSSNFAHSYAVIAETVLATAKEDPPAVFLSPGSPLLLNSISRYLLVEAKKRGLSTVTLPGVSMFDAAIADLGIDVSTAGLQVMAARGFVGNPAGVNPRMPLLLLEAGSAVSEGGGFRDLLTSLRSSYPDNQPVTVLKPAPVGLNRSTTALGKLKPGELALDPGDALFVDVARGAPALAGER